MSKTLDELKRDATDGVEYFRDHELGEWDDGERHSAADCVKCGLGVSVTPDPLPNEIDIGGGAVAMDCPGVTACPKCGEALELITAALTPTTSIKPTTWQSRGANFFVIGTCKCCQATIEVGVDIADRPIVAPF